MVDETRTGEKIIRTVCVFTRHPGAKAVSNLRHLARRLTAAGYQVQTLRICSPGTDFAGLEGAVEDPDILLSAGTLDAVTARAVLPRFGTAERVHFNVDLTHTPIEMEHAELLSRIIRDQPENSFRFAYTFNNPASSPYFPSAQYEQEGFAVGLQSTNLAADQQTLEGWLSAVERVWMHLHALLQHEPGYLGIDSSVAPLHTGASSLVNVVRRLQGDFDHSVTTDLYLRLTHFMRHRNPHPVGLCGLMLPCLEDFELAQEYEAGRFPLERNLFLSMHCGLGIDTYPVGVDENPARLAEVLRVVQGLSLRHGKALSVRLVSDGKAGVGHRTDFGNQYLADVVVRPL